MYQLIALLFLSTVYAQFNQDANCNYTGLTYVRLPNVTAILGTWYQIERITNLDETGECASKIFSEVNNTYTLNSTEVVSGKLNERIGVLTLTSLTNPGVLNLTYNDGASLDVLVLGTDYSEYLVVYGCQNNGTRSAVNAWKLGRNVTLSSSAQTVTTTLVNAAGLANATWKEVSFNETACKITNAGVTLQTSPLILLMIGFLLKKD